MRVRDYYLTLVQVSDQGHRATAGVGINRDSKILQRFLIEHHSAQHLERLIERNVFNESRARDRLRVSNQLASAEIVRVNGIIRRTGIRSRSDEVVTVSAHVHSALCDEGHVSSGDLNGLVHRVGRIESSDPSVVVLIDKQNEHLILQRICAAISVCARDVVQIVALYGRVASLQSERKTRTCCDIENHSRARVERRKQTSALSIDSVEIHVRSISGPEVLVRTRVVRRESVDRRASAIVDEELAHVGDRTGSGIDFNEIGRSLSLGVDELRSDGIERRFSSSQRRLSSARERSSPVESARSERSKIERTGKSQRTREMRNFFAFCFWGTPIMLPRPVRFTHRIRANGLMWF
jgi:hypothetical protein